MRQDAQAQALDDAAVLAEPARRALYDYVSRAGREVGRDEAAKALHLQRPLAAFHLDKLVDAGFLQVAFRRLSGRSGPGAGRPSKLYTRSAKQLEVSVPPRRYELLARLLIRAVAKGGSATHRELTSAAEELGAQLADEARHSAGARADRAHLLAAAERTLAAHGFEPRRERGTIRLGNCPFDALAAEHRDVVCEMNHELMTGLVDHLGVRGVSAELDPQPGGCCVALRTTASRRPGTGAP